MTVTITCGESQAATSSVRSNETCLPTMFALGQPADPAFPNDVHSPVTRNRLQRAFDASEPLAGDQSFLHKSVILFDDIIQVL